MRTKASSRPSPATPAFPSRGRSRWEWHYRTLLGARKRLLRESAERERESAGSGDRGTGRKHRSGEQLNLDTSLAMLASEARLLGEVEAALLRIKRGVYGYCMASGRRIPLARLRAIPWCRYRSGVGPGRLGGEGRMAP